MKLGVQIQEIDNGFIVNIAGQQNATTGGLEKAPVTVYADAIDDVLDIVKRHYTILSNGIPKIVKRS